MSDKKRRIPRHVDSRIMVYMIPLKTFLILLAFVIPIAVLIIVVLTNVIFSPFILLAGFILCGIPFILFSEINYRETGFDILKSIIRYSLEGDKFYTRGYKCASTDKRRTRN